MERCLNLIIGFICIICVSGQTTQTVCWDSKWYNDSGVLGNRSSYEHQPVNVLNAICSSGSVTAAECNDNKGEPFKGSRNDTGNNYYVTCSHVNGLICHPYNNSRNATCPDFAIRYGCNCPTKTTTGGNLGGPGGGSTTLKTGDENGVSGYKTGGGGSQTSGQQNGYCRNDGQQYGASHLVLLLCTMTLKVLF